MSDQPLDVIYPTTIDGCTQGWVMSINDWATKAAEHIVDEGYAHPSTKQQRIDRVAAIIETFAKPLLNVVHLARREHFSHTTAEGMWFGCPRHWCDDEQEDTKCICGADAWNARIEAALSGLESIG